MKKAALLLLLPFFALAESVSNSESKSYSSGANINNQTVINESDSFKVEDVRCPVPTLGIIGGVNSVDGNRKTEQFHIGIGVNIPLFSGDCDVAVDLKIKKMQFDLQDREVLLKIKEEQHMIKMINACNELKVSIEVCNEILND